MSTAHAHTCPPLSSPASHSTLPSPLHARPPVVGSSPGLMSTRGTEASSRAALHLLLHSGRRSLPAHPISRSALRTTALHFSFFPLSSLPASSLLRPPSAWSILRVLGMATAASSSASEDSRAAATAAASSPSPVAFPPFRFLHSSYQPPYRLPPSPVPSFYDLHSWPDDPLHVFCSWYADAERAYHAHTPPAEGVSWPNTMQLATAVDGMPHVRHVLLKGLDARGLVFFTNYEGGKGRQLRANASVALCFYWKGLERQVRVEGRAEEVSGEESDNYFHARPLGSQISAGVSCQSRPISSRAELEEHYVQQVQAAIRALQAAKGGQRADATRPSSAPSLPLSIPSVASSPSSSTSSSAVAAASHAQHAQSVAALAELQQDASAAPLLRTAITRPPHWGGILIRPHLIEFWEDGQYRLHSRVEYTRTHTRAHSSSHEPPHAQQQAGEKQQSADAGSGPTHNGFEGHTSEWEWSKRFLAP